MEYTIERFVNAHEKDFQQALAEIKKGQKRSHWMWYIFPQLRSLGHSEIAKHYGIVDLSEAKAFLEHPILGKNLIEISEALLNLKSDDATQIMGSPDDLKLKSSMTLFSSLPNAPKIFYRVLDKFYSGEKDEKTMALLRGKSV